MAQVETHEWPAATSTHTPNWNPAIWASIIAGLVFAAQEVLLVWAVRHQSPWMPVQMIGAIGLGSSAMSPPDTFDLTIIGFAVVCRARDRLMNRRPPALPLCPTYVSVSGRQAIRHSSPCTVSCHGVQFPCQCKRGGDHGHVNGSRPKLAWRGADVIASEGSSLAEGAALSQ